MSDIWPLDVKRKLDTSVRDNIRPFKCLLLMPFKDQFNNVADLLKGIIEAENAKFRMPLPEIQRLDWITSSNVIHQEIWQEIYEADLVICDITGFNPNVMVELGVSAAWKKIHQVVLIKDHSSKQRSAFDIAPFRYTEYDLEYPGVDIFRAKVHKLVNDALLAFPDELGIAQAIQFPLHIDFSTNRDDPRIYTPPFAHRRIIGGALEFGSIYSYADSWASIGREPIGNFTLRFSAKFSHPSPEAPKIGLAVRSHHYFANYGHHISLAGDGSIWITKPNEQPPNFYDDEKVREQTDIELEAFCEFSVEWNEKEFRFSIDDFEHNIEVSKMEKQFDAGLIRFHSARSWMAISEIHLEVHDQS
jgi:hypothetical protein